MIPWYLILALVLAALAAGAAAAYFISVRVLRRRADTFRALCVVREVRRSRVPGLGCAVLEYSGRDRARHASATRWLPRARLPRVGAKVPGVVCRVRAGSGGFRYWVELP